MDYNIIGNYKNKIFIIFHDNEYAILLHNIPYSLKYAGLLFDHFNIDINGIINGIIKKYERKVKFEKLLKK